MRFSTVAGNKGSFDLARDVRGFAVKLNTRKDANEFVQNCDQLRFWAREGG